MLLLLENYKVGIYTRDMMPSNNDSRVILYSERTKEELLKDRLLIRMTDLLTGITVAIHPYKLKNILRDWCMSITV